MTRDDLHKYQKRCTNFIAGSGGSAILSVDMGLGKTAATVFFIDWLRETKRIMGDRFDVVIVAPKRVAENQWHTEAAKWGLYELASLCAVVKGTPTKRRDALRDDTRPVKIVSRDNLAEVVAMYNKTKLAALVLDELTTFKNPASARSKLVQQFAAEYKIGLTGTFLANGAIDIFGQAAAVGLTWGGLNFYAWRATYFRDCLAGSGLQFQKWVPRVPLAGILDGIKKHIFTLTADDYLDIPETMETTHEIELDKETAGAYKNLEAFLGFELDGETLSVDEGAKFAKLQTLCNGFVYITEDGQQVGRQRGKRSAKLEAVADFVAECKDAGEPVLLFYAFKEEAIWLSELLTARGVKFESVQKSGFLERWNEGKTECLFAHPASAGHGLNLQHGGRVIVWSSLTYNYEYFAQANARLARQGQKKNVQIHYFIADGTCEARVVQTLRAKDKAQREFLSMTKQ